MWRPQRRWLGALAALLTLTLLAHQLLTPACFSGGDSSARLLQSGPLNPVRQRRHGLGETLRVIVGLYVCLRFVRSHSRHLQHSSIDLCLAGPIEPSRP